MTFARDLLIVMLKKEGINAPDQIVGASRFSRSVSTDSKSSSIR